MGAIARIFGYRPQCDKRIMLWPGRARVEKVPNRRNFSPGDCLVLPAGTGHKNLGCSHDFQVIGAYPPGQHADIQRSAPTEEMLSRIASLPLPRTDPVQGISGVLLDKWR